jgi:hypothetical protein
MWEEIRRAGQQPGTAMPDNIANVEIAPSRTAVMVMAAVVGAILAGTVALWAHYGTAVFFETIRAGFAACFG